MPISDGQDITICPAEQMSSHFKVEATNVAGMSITRIRLKDYAGARNMEIVSRSMTTE